MMHDLSALPDLPTPSLLLDLDALEANIALLAACCRSRKVCLRPHAKTHKASAIARLQIAAGAIGIAAATIAEAAGLARAGIPGILITTPIAGSWKLGALRDLVRSGADVMCVAETTEGVRLLAEALSDIGRRVPVLVDFDSGHGRSGARTAEACVDVAQAIAASPPLDYAGLQSYAGHVQHIVDLAAREAAQSDVNGKVRNAVSMLARAGFTPAIVSGGGTGSVFRDADEGVFTEIQAGSYVVMDEEYLSLQRRRDEPLFAPALHLLATVVADAGRGWVTIDAGTKALAAGFMPARPMIPGSDARYLPMGDEHGAIDGAPRSATGLGQRLLMRPAHCDPTINLHNVLYGFRKGVHLPAEIFIDLRV